MLVRHCSPAAIKPLFFSAEQLLHLPAALPCTCTFPVAAPAYFPVATTAATTPLLHILLLLQASLSVGAIADYIYPCSHLNLHLNIVNIV